MTGQGRERGGDSSGVLVGWLRGVGGVKRRVDGKGGRKRKRDGEEEEEIQDNMEKKSENNNRADLNCTKFPTPFNVLEIGALSPDNQISSLVASLNASTSSSKLNHNKINTPASPLHARASISRIDLHSQHPAIKTQDFMDRPLPKSEEDKFDIISLSLVLNYVPDAMGRGDMLKRTCAFLRRQPSVTGEEKGQELDTAPTKSTDEEMEATQNDADQPPFPCLFLVLPAPCVTNSRYLTEAHLSSIMTSIGYALLQRKLSAKLVYYLWRWDGWPEGTSGGKRSRKFAKKEMNPGKGRNNFCVVVN